MAAVIRRGSLDILDFPRKPKLRSALETCLSLHSIIQFCLKE